MDFNDFGGMPADEFYLMQSVEEDEERQRMLEEQEEYERQKDADLSHITFEQERIEQNRRMGYAGGSCLIALFSLIAMPMVIILAIIAII